MLERVMEVTVIKTGGNFEVIIIFKIIFSTFYMTACFLVVKLLELPNLRLKSCKLANKPISKM